MTVYYSFDKYCEGIQTLYQVVLDTENLVIQLSQAGTIDEASNIEKTRFELRNKANTAIRQVEDNDYSKGKFTYNNTNNEEIRIIEYQKRCETMNKDFAKIKARYEEAVRLFYKTYCDILQNISLGTNAKSIPSDNETFKLIVQKLEAEAKIKEADAVIAAAEKAKADLAIEENKTKQLQLQADERKAREEEAIMSMEERCQIMYNEYLKTLQEGISGNVSDNGSNNISSNISDDVKQKRNLRFRNLFGRKR